MLLWLQICSYFHEPISNSTATDSAEAIRTVQAGSQVPATHMHGSGDFHFCKLWHDAGALSYTCLQKQVAMLISQLK